MLFPRLRPGGLYVIEDWSFRHLRERGVRQAMKANPGGKATSGSIAARDEEEAFDVPMSFLICQLVIAAGYRIDWITDVRVTDGFCEIRRGDADISPGTPISEYIGYVGSRMLETKHV